MIISASKRTDIPALYSDWFIANLEKGCFYVRNPMYPKNVSIYIFEKSDIDAIVFWTKYPRPMFKHLDYLQSHFNFYFQYSINDYPKDIEKNIPGLDERIRAFQELSKTIGKEKIIWRYDPIILSKDFSTDYHIEKFEYLAMKLSGYTNRVMISFLDFYRKISSNIVKLGFLEPSESDVIKIISSFTRICKVYGIEIFGCAEDKYGHLGLSSGKCIDEGLLNKLFNLNINLPESKERDECHCVKNIDVGVYNTCIFGCVYCYASYSKAQITNNLINHSVDSPMLIGNLGSEDKSTRTILKKSSKLSTQIELDLE